ncbi:hypothetical protein QKD39_gp25 [Psittacine adenovirus 1]|uniref:Uncharacterized protein n=1 Tax=Psittacine adenovirus 1 TaxID=318592 RepID=A0A2Z5E0J3_9ADEN|nr:hypothetical protein QKD39_gp25 [Psittacine adenovirus 1]AXB73054.1 hypothetical protein [Psittacine adenovirus 1]
MMRGRRSRRSHWRRRSSSFIAADARVPHALQDGMHFPSRALPSHSKNVMGSISGLQSLRRPHRTKPQHHSVLRAGYLLRFFTGTERTRARASAERDIGVSYLRLPSDATTRSCSRFPECRRTPIRGSATAPFFVGVSVHAPNAQRLPLREPGLYAIGV